LSDLEIRAAHDGDVEELFALYALVVEEGGAFPTAPPATRADFERAWMREKSAVFVARSGGCLAGSYHLLPNYPGRASHIANAGYMVHPDFRGKGIGRKLVEHSIAEAPRHGFDALMFNLVFESNPARRLYERLGFVAVGRVPEAFDGEDAIVYWRKINQSQAAAGAAG
jgi:ribosomal protein S18 acetylase RimI-like enzyme